MDRKQERALVKETKALIKEVEAGDTDHAAWVAIQDRVKQLYDGRTQAEVGAELGKTEDWVGHVVRWDSADPRKPTPHAGPRGEKREASTAKKVLADPEQRKTVIAELDSETRTEVMQEVWAQEEADLKADPVLTPDQERSVKQTDDKLRARKQIHNAVWALRSRLEFYGDIPLDDNEKAYLPMIRTLLDRLEAGAEMDDELRELIENAA